MLEQYYFKNQKEPWQMTRKEFINRAPSEFIASRLIALDEKPKTSDEVIQARLHVDEMWKRLYDAGIGYFGAKHQRTAASGYFKLPKTKLALIEKFDKAYDRLDKVEKENHDDYQGAWHYIIVKDAVAKDFPVPKEVLKDYPNLVR